MFGLMRVKTHTKLMAHQQRVMTEEVWDLEHSLYEGMTPPEAVKRWTDQGLEVVLTSSGNANNRSYRFSIKGKNALCRNCGELLNPPMRRGW